MRWQILRTLSRLLIPCLVFLWGAAFGVEPSPPAQLRLAVLAFRTTNEVTPKWQAFESYLSEATGEKVSLKVMTLPELDAAVAAGTVDAVLTNSGDYILLKSRFGLSAPLATMVLREQGRPVTQFGGVIFTRADSHLDSLRDLDDQRIALASPASLGGYQLQVMELQKAGRAEPSEAQLDILGPPQDRVVEAVLGGQAAVGFVRTGLLESMAAEGRLKLEQIRIINPITVSGFPFRLSTSLQPEWPVAVTPQVSTTRAVRLTVALLSLGPGEAAAEQAGIYGFTIPADYSGVENILRRLRMPPFERAPDFTLRDLWQRYAPWIIALGTLALALLLALTRSALATARARLATQRFAKLFEASPEPTWILAHGHFIDCNPAAVAIYGVADKHTLLGKSPVDFSPARQPDGESSEQKSRGLLAAASKTPQHFEWRHARPDGSTFDAAISLTAAELDGRQVLLGVLHDISHLKAIASALREAELFARTTIDAVGARLCVLDASGCVTAINRAWREGDDDQPVVALNPIEHPGHALLAECTQLGEAGNALAAHIAAGIREVITLTRASFNIEYAGSEAHAQHWFSLSVTPFQGNSGHVVVIIASITERKQSELRLRHHNSILRMLAQREALPDVLDTIASNVEAMNPAVLCSILLLEDGCLRHGAGPSLPAAYRDAIDGTPIGPNAGSCGAAAYHGKRMIASDIDLHPNWEAYRPLAHAAGLRACWSEPILGADGSVLGTFALYHRTPTSPEPGDLQLIEDEAHLVALAIELGNAEVRLQRAASVFTFAREGILITDRNGNVSEVNDAFVQLTGYSREEVLGHNPRMLKSGRQGPEFYNMMWQSLNRSGQWSGEIWNRKKSGEVYAELLTISAVRDSKGEILSYVALFTDITHIKEHQRDLERIAHYDALTALPNRVLLADRLGQAMLQCARSGRALAVLYLDLDGFKAINDQHGHDAGDELLVAVSLRMKATLRQGDTLARIGGDEFVAVLTDLQQQRDCDEIISRMLQAVATPVMVRGVPLLVSASIGVTMYPEDDVEADVLLRHADQAMYLAKQTGKNRHHHFDVARDTALKTQFESVAKIREALQQGQFELYYQPKVNLRTRQLTGVEGLLRWHHPERGLLYPGSFLPLLEGHDLEIELGDWVLETALRHLSEWRAQDFDCPISVNISASQLQQADFDRHLASLLERYPDAAASRLELEVLETSALGDLDEISRTLTSCRALGVRFALDDFGTGYSSLVYLQRLPVDVVKIDQSFVHNLLHDSDSRAIVEGVVGLARAFRREVIAEGVESWAQASCLLEIGCEQVQGWCIAHPMPAETLQAWAGRLAQQIAAEEERSQAS